MPENKINGCFFRFSYISRVCDFKNIFLSEKFGVRKETSQTAHIVSFGENRNLSFRKSISEAIKGGKYSSSPEDKSPYNTDHQNDSFDYTES